MNDELIDDFGKKKKQEYSLLLFWVLVIQAVLCFLSFIAELIQVETIVVSGGVLLLSGILTVVLGALRKNGWAIVHGVLVILLVGLILGLINLYGLGPSRARKPVAYIAMVFNGMFIPYTIFICRREWKKVKRKPE